MQKQKQVNVLITGVGGNRAVFIWKALKKTNLPVRVVGCDISPLAMGLYRADASYIVPSAYADDYLEKLKEIILREKIDIIMIGTNEEFDVLSQHSSDIKDATGAYVVVPPMEAFEIAKDKWALACFLEKNSFAFPKSVLPEDTESLKSFLKEVPFPYIVKERFSSGSRGLHISHDRGSMEEAINEVDSPVVQEYLHPDDEEYTVGCFCDMNKKAAGSIVMKRKLASGMTNQAQALKNQEISDYCKAVSEKIGFVGPLNLQLRLTKHGPVIFEINPRFSSTESARAFYNYNMPEMCIRHFVLGEQVSPPATTSGYFFRYLEDVFIDSKDVDDMSRTGFSNKRSGTIISNF